MVSQRPKDQTDIERGNAAVEAYGAEVEPGTVGASPVMLVDSMLFRAFTGSAEARDEAVKAMFSESIAGIIENGNASTDRRPGGGREEKEKKEKAWRLAQQSLQQSIDASNKAIDDFIKRYKDMADWYRENSAKAAENMGKIATRMGENSAFIEGVNEIAQEKLITGKFNREKALNLFQNRGIKIDQNASDDKLFSLLGQYKLYYLKNNSDLSQRYEEQKGQNEKFNEKAREIEEKRQELIKKQKEINENGNLSGEEKLDKLHGIDKEYKSDIKYASSVFNENTQDAQKYKETYVQDIKEIAEEDVSAALLADFEAEKTGSASAVKNQFSNASAVKTDQSFLEKPSSPEVQGKKTSPMEILPIRPG